jgi:uncharacterized membrane protein
MKDSRFFQVTVIAVLTLTYAAARLWNLTASCLWFDEIFSVHAATHSWATILRFVAKDLIHPPLFYLLLKVWILAGGDGIFWLRLFPVLISVAAIVPFLYLTRELKLSDWSRSIAYLLFAVNGSLIRYSQEVRMYSLLLCISLVSIWLFVRYFHKGKGLPVLIIVNVVLVYTHYFGWFVLLSEVAAIAIFQRIKIRAVLIMLGITLLSFLPWASAVWLATMDGSQLGQNIGWMQRPGIFATVQTGFNLVEPFYYPASNAEPFTILIVSVPLILVIIAGLIIGTVSGRNMETEKWETKRLLAIFIVLPLVAAFAVSWIAPYSIWGTRHLIIVFLPLSLLIAAVIGKIEIAAIKITIISLIILISGCAFSLQIQRDAPNYIWCAWEPLAVEAAARSESKVYVFEDLVAYHFWFAAHENRSMIEVSKIKNVDGVTEDTAYFLPRGFDEIPTLELPDVSEPRLWIAYRGQSIDPSVNPLRAFFDRGYRISDRKVLAATGESAILILLEK